jgi:FMN reductase
MKTIIISSSLSDNSRSFILCKKIEEELKSLNVDTILVDIRKMKLEPYHRGPTKDMEKLASQIEEANNIIIGMGVHNYTINDSLKMVLSGCFDGAKNKFFGIVCAAGGDRSYLSTMHLTQICMNEWRMMQLPRIVYATKNDFVGNEISNDDVLERIKLFSKEFKKIGEKLLK